MGKKRTTVKVKPLGMKSKRRRKRTYAVYINHPSGTEYRLPNTDTKVRSEAIRKARQIRKQRRRRG